MKAPFHRTNLKLSVDPASRPVLTLSHFLSLGPPSQVLEQRMRELGLTSADVAARSGLPIATIAALLAGDVRFGRIVARALGEGIGPSSDYWDVVQAVEDARRAMWR